MSAQPPLAFNEVGNQHTFTFLCGTAVGLLTGPASNPVPTTGCFDVQASVVDISVGVDVPISAASCGPYPAAIAENASCSNVFNPICAAGTTFSNGSCALVCPQGFQPSAPGCTAPPANGVCPSGSTAVFSPQGTILYCLAPTITTPTVFNEASVTFFSGAPHAFLVQFNGFLPTRPDGTCPEGTTRVPSTTLIPPTRNSQGYVGPACAFTVGAEKKYIEVNTLTINPRPGCGEAISSGVLGLQSGHPCFFTVSAEGQVILKSGVNCTDGSEPATGTDASPAGFPLGAVYSCSGTVLAVTNIPVPHVPIHVTANNGFFTPTCVPEERFITPTATSTAAPPTDTPVESPTATLTPTATAAPTLIPSPTPVGTPPPPFTIVPRCGPPGIPFIDTFTTSAVPTAPVVGYSAAPTNAVVTQGSLATIRGLFTVDGSATAGADMFATFHFPGHDAFCNVITGPDGIGQCSVDTDSTPPGTVVPVDVEFVWNCAEFTVSTSFVIGGPGTPTPVSAGPAPVMTSAGPIGICVVRQGYGDLTVEATTQSIVNTQPPVSSGIVNLGTFGVPTPTPSPIPTDTPIPTNTPVPTATDTPLPPTDTPTATDTPTPTETPTPRPPTATPTPTPRPSLQWSLDAARVQKSGSRANMKGITRVRRGQTVWLFVYYTVSHVPKKVTRYQTYAVLRANKTMSSKTYKGTQHKGETGRYARFDTWTAPRNAPLGRYVFKGTVRLDGKTRSAIWKFQVTR